MCGAHALRDHQRSGKGKMNPSGFEAFIRPLGGLLGVALRASPSAWWRSWLLAFVAFLARVLLVVYRLLSAVKSLLRLPA